MSDARASAAAYRATSAHTASVAPRVHPERRIGIGADERRHAAGEDRYRERRKRAIRQGDLVGAADEVDATICEVLKAARNRYPLDGERRSRERPLERVRDAIAERDRISLGLSRFAAMRHRRRISAIAECDPVGTHDAVERGRWAWRLRHLRLCSAGSRRRRVRSSERQRDCGDCCQRAGGREQARKRHRATSKWCGLRHVRSPCCLSRRSRDRGGLRRGAARHQEPRGHEQPDEPAESHHEHAAHDCLDT